MGVQVPPGAPINNSMNHLGNHLIIDLWEAKNILDSKFITDVIIKCVEEVGAKLLKIDIHEFNNGGYTGVALLAESHISIHTWPEYDNYMAIDIFVCNDLDPYKIIPILEKEFQTNNYKVTEIKRGPVL